MSSRHRRRRTAPLLVAEAWGEDGIVRGPRRHTASAARFAAWLAYVDRFDGARPACVDPAFADRQLHFPWGGAC